MNQFLYVGDVLFLNDGFRVNSEEIPAYCFSESNCYDTTPSAGSILIGSRMTAKNSAITHRFHIEKIITDEFKKRGLELDPKILEAFLNHQIPSFTGEDYTLPAGFYIITDLKLRGARHDVFCQTYPMKQDQVIRKVNFTILQAGFENANDVALVKRSDDCKLVDPG